MRKDLGDADIGSSLASVSCLPLVVEVVRALRDGLETSWRVERCVSVGRARLKTYMMLLARVAFT